MGEVRAARPRPVLIATAIVAVLFTLLGLPAKIPWLGLFLAGFIPVGYGIVQLIKRRANLGAGMAVGGVVLGFAALMLSVIFAAPQPDAPIAAEPVAQAPASAPKPAPAPEPTTAQQVLARAAGAGGCARRRVRPWLLRVEQPGLRSQWLRPAQRCAEA